MTRNHITSSFSAISEIPYSGPQSALAKGRSVISMNNALNQPGEFRIEISGWGLDNFFFAERTDLHWNSDGEKYVQLHRALPEGAIVFIRLLASEPGMGSVPVAYRAEAVLPMDCNGRCQMRLAQLRPRLKESLARKTASNVAEDSQKVCNVQEFEIELQHEEILQ
jgi:hypothetical protein